MQDMENRFRYIGIWNEASLWVNIRNANVACFFYTHDKSYRNRFQVM